MNKTLLILTITALTLTLRAQDTNTPTRPENHGGGPIPTKHNEATVTQLQAEMTQGKLTSEQLTREYLDRIAALDQRGEGVNSIIELNPDALDMAKNADKLRKKGQVLGPLHGIPVLLKDNIDTGDK
ncbi:MAG: amidase family protein, partial [Chthoniobacterales bacterium]